MDRYQFAMVRMAELRRKGERGRAPRDGGPSASRPRIVVAKWLMVAAERLWPEVGGKVLGGAR